MTGIVITLARLITAVSEIDSATSPRANAVRILEVGPPGAAAMIIRPSASSGAIGQTLARTKATVGSRTIWERAPTAKSRGRRTTRAKSSKVSPSPSPNMMKASASGSATSTSNPMALGHSCF
jgi:hypothetical protein